MREVVTDDPFVPGQREPVEVLLDARENASGNIRSRRCGIESDPATAGEENFYPAMCVAGAHYIIAGEIVVFAGQKAIDLARGDPQGAQHNGHGGGKIFTVASASLK